MARRAQLPDPRLAAGARRQSPARPVRPRRHARALGARRGGARGLAALARRAAHGDLDVVDALDRRRAARVLRRALGRPHARHAAPRAPREDGALGARVDRRPHDARARRSSPASAAYGAYLATTASGFLNSVFIAGPTEPPVDGRYNILLLGGDSGPDREGMRPDSISVVSIDAETGQAVTIGLPRDLEYVPFPDDSPLAAVYPEGYGVDRRLRGRRVPAQLDLHRGRAEEPRDVPERRQRGLRARHRGHARRRRGHHRPRDPVLRAHRHAGLRSSSSTRSAASTSTSTTRIPIGGDEDHQRRRRVDRAGPAAPRRLPRALVRPGALRHRRRRLRPDGPPARAAGGDPHPVHADERARASSRRSRAAGADRS